MFRRFCLGLATLGVVLLVANMSALAAGSPVYAGGSGKA